jgi:hypothetical protein
MVRVATKNDLMPGTLEMLILHTLTHRHCPRDADNVRSRKCLVLVNFGGA